jgi:hypothetical protein
VVVSKDTERRIVAVTFIEEKEEVANIKLYKLLPKAA